MKKIWLKIKQSKNTHIFHLQLLTLIDRSTTRWPSQKRILLLFLDLFSLSNTKRLFRKMFLEVNLVSLALNWHYFLEFLRNRSQFRCTASLRSTKLVDLDGENLTWVFQNEVDNSMHLVLDSKSRRKEQENGYNK